MKTLLLSFALLLPAVALAQPFSIDWHTVVGGGGTSAGGVYSLSGTVGQPDAGGPMTGGSYSVTGGVWSLLAVVPTAGAPTLTITHSGNTVMVSWPYPSTGWTLEQNPNVTPANWSPSGGVSNDGTKNFLTITSPTGNLFFRLSHP